MDIQPANYIFSFALYFFLIGEHAKPDGALSSIRLQRASFATRGFLSQKTKNTEIVENGGNAQTSGLGHISDG